jgi:hypothetical protein
MDKALHQRFLCSRKEGSKIIARDVEIRGSETNYDPQDDKQEDQGEETWFF